MREFAHKRQTQSEQQLYQGMAAMRSVKTDDERQKIWQEQNRALVSEYYQNDSEFRSAIMPDAVYVRNELLKRKLQEPPPARFSPSKQSIDNVFIGSLSGVHPELDAADYLQQMAKQLRLK